MKVNIEKICKYCKIVFTTNNNKKLYCSDTCRTYNSQERNGKLNPTQQAIKEGVVKIAGEPEPDKPAIKPDLVKDHLRAFFVKALILHEHDGEYYKTYQGHAYAHTDEEFGLDNVQDYDEGRYVVVSASKTIIQDVKDKYSGSKIFEGITPKKGRYFDEDVETFYFKVFKTVVERERVVEVDGLFFL